MTYHAEFAPRRGRSWLIATPLILVLALAAGWSALWFYASGEAETRINAWQAQQAVAQSLGLSTYFVTRRGFRDNLIQYLPTGAERQPEGITGALEHFAAARHLPDRGRGILEHCIVSTGFPLEG